ncbi:MAG: methyl-accepting chemotaxis protein [Treponema sp.]|jgi:methyl-accepting chemotaxis protein|nr:methyl-accepting chemotaxis protein [Treponema sp.]
MKIGKKLIMMIVALNLMGTGVLVGTILRIVQVQVTTLVNSEVKNLVEKNASDIKIWFDRYFSTARTVAQIMEQHRNIELTQRRSLYNMIMKGLVETNSDIAAVSSCWEPNALDGLDDQYVNTPGTDSTGRFIPYWSRTNAGVTLEALVDYTVPGPGDYYIIPMRTGNETLVEPYFYPINGEERLITTVAIPIRRNGRMVGTMSFDIDMVAIQHQVEGIKPYEGSIAAVYTNGGLVSGHFDSTRIGKPMAQTEADLAGPYLDGLIEAVREGKEFFYTAFVPQVGKKMFFTCTPFTAGMTATPWSLAVGVPLEVVSAPIYKLLFISIIIGAGMILITSAAAFAISRSISKPLDYLVVMLRDVGEGDLTRRLEVRSRDEIGAMAGSFNGTLEKVQDLIRIIKDKTVSLSDIGMELQSTMTENAASITEITANIRQMKTQIANQTASVEESGGLMEKITRNIDELNGHIDRQSSSVSQSSSAIEEMLANIQSVTHTLIKNADNVKDLSAASEIGRAGLQEVSSDIQEIARESQGLLEINAVMENIASQTNLLSMNAAIEAAHAGEAGKGFAVVAGEIRKLAESSGKQSQIISGVLKKIKASIDKIIKSTDVVLNRFEVIDQGVRTVSDQEENIRNAMEEQGEGSQQILEAISRLNEITGLVKDGSSHMLLSSQEAIGQSKTLETISQEISHGMTEMATGADQINTSVNRVSEICGENKDNIEALIREVAKFKVER